MLLHDVLHVATNLGSSGATIGISNTIQVTDTLHAFIVLETWKLVSWRTSFSDAKGSGSSKDDNVQKRVGSQPVGTVDRSGGSFTSCKESWNNGVFDKLAILVVNGLYDFTVIVGRNASHIVVYSRQDGNRLLGNIDARKNGCRFTNSRKTFGQELWRQVIEVKVNVILLGTNATSLSDFHSHGTADDITRRQVLCRGSITFHKALSFRVA
mmetsp:Transcript_223/g.412  ORF Transcript_223/g.412 Transcript_223/m.412 type:complete len:211 (+) Transcript_223:485-1117(+)